MFAPKIKLDAALYERLRKCGEIAGYSSTDEFISHTLEQAVQSLEEAASEQQVEKQLQGLGYID
jgi:hypothetical protein